MRDFFTRWHTILGRIGAMSLSFLGVGLYRAWLAIFFRYGAYPTIGVADYALFEVSIGVASLAAALCAKRLAPLWNNTRALSAAGVCMVAGSVACAVQTAVPSVPGIRHVGLILAGAGLAITILAWCEFYGTLNPMRVSVYHAASIFFGELLCWFFMTVEFPGLVAMSVVLPVLALWWSHRAVDNLPADGRPQPITEPFQRIVPWKAVALMATCTFAAGFNMLPDQPIVPGNIVGVLAATTFVFFGSLSTSRWFNFDTIYRIAFPLMIACLLLITPLLSHRMQITAAFFDAGYTMLSMFIMIILSNITYRFGVNAVWLNGIERGIRYLTEAVGWYTFALSSRTLPPAVSLAVHLVITATALAMFLVIAFTEKSLSARWGIDLHAADGGDTAGDVFTPGALSMRVSNLSKQHGLSDREEEVLQLMARKVPMAQMEEDLFVARGTIKAHTSRIYRKLGVHTKDELFELLGVEGPPEKSGVRPCESTPPRA